MCLKRHFLTICSPFERHKRISDNKTHGYEIFKAIIQFPNHELCLRYGIWLMLFPVCGAAGIIFYGVFTAMTYTSPVRNSMLLTLLVWLTAWYFLVPQYGNDGLWMVYLAFSLGRSGFLLLWLPSSHKRMRV